MTGAIDTPAANCIDGEWHRGAAGYFPAQPPSTWIACPVR